MNIKTLAKIIGESAILAANQVAIGSVSMSSKFSVLNFSKDQVTLQNALEALRSYMRMGLFWGLATMLVMYASYDMIGLITSFIANFLLMAWIILSYKDAFESAAKNYNLIEPTLFEKSDLVLIGILITGVVLLFHWINLVK